MNIDNIILALEEEKGKIREDADERISSIEITISSLKQRHYLQSLKTNDNKEDNANDYKGKYKGYDKLNTRQKALAIFREEGRFLHMREIIKIAQRLEPDKDAAQIGKKISTSIYTIKNLDNSPLTNVSVENSNQNTFWGSKNWIGEDGKILEGHMYDERQITSKQKSLLEI